MPSVVCTHKHLYINILKQLSSEKLPNQTKTKNNNAVNSIRTEYVNEMSQDKTIKSLIYKIIV